VAGVFSVAFLSGVCAFEGQRCFLIFVCVFLFVCVEIFVFVCECVFLCLWLWLVCVCVGLGVCSFECKFLLFVSVFL